LESLNLNQSLTRKNTLVVVFLVMLFRLYTAGQKAADNPWGEGATTLEWTLPSPPPFHTYEELPVTAAAAPAH